MKIKNLTLTTPLVFAMAVSGCVTLPQTSHADLDAKAFNLTNESDRRVLPRAEDFWQLVEYDVRKPREHSRYVWNTDDEDTKLAFSKLIGTSVRLWSLRLPPFDTAVRPAMPTESSEVRFGWEGEFEQDPVTWSLLNHTSVKSTMQTYTRTGRLPPQTEAKLRELGKEWMFDYKPADAEAARAQQDKR